MTTLHAYILRELLKTFGLALVALTLLFTLGGGLFQLVKFEGITATDILRFIPTLLPIVMTLMMPMAAMFAATMVYGRLAADNELTACRAAGINVHRLFLAAGLLSLFVGAFTLFFGNVVVPGLMKQIEGYARVNLRDIVAQGLQNRGYVQRAQDDRIYALTAERVDRTGTAELSSRGFETGPGLSYLGVVNPTFVVSRADGEVERFAVARYGLCRFDTRQEDIFITVYLVEGRDFEIGRSIATLNQQQIGPWRFPLRLPRRLSTADLATLLEWRAAPWKYERLREKLTDFIQVFTLQDYYAGVLRELERGGALVLSDPADRTYEVRGSNPRLRERGLSLSEATVLVRRPDEPRPTRYVAPRCEIVARPLRGEIPVTIRLEESGASRVLEYNPRSLHPERPAEKSKLSLDGPQLPPDVVRQGEQYSPEALLDPRQPLPGSASADLDDDRRQFWADKRQALLREAEELRRKITATIHFRLGFTSSILFTLVLGATLGVIFRGARALAAFGLATVPFFSALILMSLAKQLTESSAASTIGPYVTWGGLATLGLATFLTIRLGVAR